MKPDPITIPQNALIANDDTQLRSLSPDPTLRNYAQDTAQENVSEVAEFLAPTVEVPTMHGRYKKYTSEYRFKVPNTKRDPNMGGVTRIGFSASDEKYMLESHSLDFPVADYQQYESEDLKNIEREGADLLSSTAHLAHEVETIDFAFNKSGLGTDFDFAANGVDVIKQFNAWLRAVKLIAKNGAGLRICMGVDAWLIIQSHPTVRAVFNGVKSSFKIPTIEQFLAMLAFKAEMKTSDIVIDLAKPGLDENMSFAMTNQILIYPCAARPNRRDSSWLKTFRLRDRWMVPGKYLTQDERDAVLKFDWNKELLETNVGSALRFNATEG